MYFESLAHIYTNKQHIVDCAYSKWVFCLFDFYFLFFFSLLLLFDFSIRSIHTVVCRLDSFPPFYSHSQKSCWDDLKSFFLCLENVFMHCRHPLMMTGGVWCAYTIEWNHITASSFARGKRFELLNVFIVRYQYSVLLWLFCVIARARMIHYYFYYTTGIMCDIVMDWWKRNDFTFELSKVYVRFCSRYHGATEYRSASTTHTSSTIHPIPNARNKIRKIKLFRLKWSYVSFAIAIDVSHTRHMIIAPGIRANVVHTCDWCVEKKRTIFNASLSTSTFLQYIPKLTPEFPCVVASINGETKSKRKKMGRKNSKI